MIHNEKKAQHVHFKHVKFCTINSVAFYMFRPADITTPPPLGWCHCTHSISTHNSTQTIFSIFFISTYILKFLYIKVTHYVFVNCFNVRRNTSFKEHLPEDGHSRWPKHVGGYAINTRVNLHIGMCTCWSCFSWWWISLEFERLLVSDINFALWDLRNKIERT
jgi:hypothetical protein